jgi:hypothetical protein
MKEVFTPRRMYLRLGMFSLCLFSTLLIASVIGMYIDCPPDRRLYGMLFAGVSWGVMAGLAAWMVLAYYRESLNLDDEEVRVTYILGQRSFRIGDVTRARWRLVPRSLTLKLFLPDGNAVLWLHGYPAEARVRLMHYLHDRLSPLVQEGWDERMDRYTGNIVQTESAEKQNKILRTLWRWVPVGPTVGLGCGAALNLYANVQGVTEIPTWTGSVLLDWIGIGLLCSLGMLSFLHGMVWLTAPESWKAALSPLGARTNR